MKHNFAQKLASIKYLSHRIILSIDAAVSGLATLVACWFCRSLLNFNISTSQALWLVLLAVAVSIGSFGLIGTYRNIIRHSTIREQWRIGSASVIKVAVLYSVLFLITSTAPDRLIVLALADLFITLVALASIRTVMVLVYDVITMKISAHSDNIMVYDINAPSVSLAGVLENNTQYRIIGFYKFGTRYRAYKIKGLPVFYFNDQKDFDIIRKRYDIKGIVFPTYESAQNEQERLVDYCVNAGVKMFVAPPVDEFNGGSLIRKPIREIRIEDLLGREEIDVNKKLLQDFFHGKTVLVTGAAGSIGSELCRQLASLDIKKLVVLDSAETPMHYLRLELDEKFPALDFIPVIGNVLDSPVVESLFRRYKPQLIFHAAAYKHVPLMEDNPCEAVRVNVLGTRNIADICVKHGVDKMIMISTDKAVNPTNVMGASKRIAEIYVQSLGLSIEAGDIRGRTKFVTTRFGNVLGSNGSVIPRFREQIENGGPVTVTHPEITRFFMTIPEACRLVMEAAAMSNGNDIYAFEMGESVKIVNLARRMISLAGFEPDKDIKIEFTGLRPGEKLYEEVMSKEEDTIPTLNKKIRIARVRQYRYEEVMESMISLERSVKDLNVETTVKIMKRRIPEYKSQNSRFEKLDNWTEQDKTVEKAAAEPVAEKTEPVAEKKRSYVQPDGSETTAS